jgi:hypothetical protein
MTHISRVLLVLSLLVVSVAAIASIDRGNTIEALVGGLADADEVLGRLLDSRDHRSHLLGEDPVFRDQDLFGVAYLRELDTPHVEHWVIIIARKARPDDPRYFCEPPPGGCWLLGGAEARREKSHSP